VFSFTVTYFVSLVFVSVVIYNISFFSCAPFFLLSSSSFLRYLSDTGALIRDLNLRRPVLKKTAAYGHFGRNDPDFTWETPKPLKF
jgi:S-adenosylmethionine synthetase, C-terminal domain